MKKRNIIFLIIVLVIALVTHWEYICGHYSTDDYNIINIGYDEYSIVNNLREGRPVMCLIDQLALRLNMSYDLFIQLTVILAILITSITVIIFYNIICKYLNTDSFKEQIIILLISYLIFFNFMYIENLYFVESIVMALTLLLYVISANCLIKRKSIILSIVLAVVGTFCYNGFLCVYIILNCVLSLLKNKGEYIKVVKDVIFAGLIIILSVLCNLIQIKYVCNIYNMTNTRMGNLKLTNIIQNILNIIVRIPAVLAYNVELFPKYCYLIFIMCNFILALVYAIKNNNKKILLDICTITLVGIASCFCIFVISLSSFWTGRLLYGIGMTIGTIFLVVFSNIEKSYRKILVLVFVIFFIINCINTVYVINTHKEVNMLEKTEVEQLDEYIKNYENQNGCIVKKITCIPDISFNNLYYNQIKRHTVITYRALACNWAYAGAVNFYTGRNLEQIQYSNEIVEFYKNTNTEANNGIICYKDILICPVSCW